MPCPQMFYSFSFFCFFFMSEHNVVLAPNLHVANFNWQKCICVARLNAKLTFTNS